MRVAVSRQINQSADLETIAPQSLDLIPPEFSQNFVSPLSLAFVLRRDGLAKMKNKIQNIINLQYIKG